MELQIMLNDLAINLPAVDIHQNTDFLSLSLCYIQGKYMKSQGAVLQ